MSHFAKVKNGIVTQVIVAEKEFIDTYVDPDPGEWVQTSYNTLGNKHVLGGTPLRGNYAGIGFIYDKENDVFYTKQPFSSWTLNKNTWLWEPPIPYPEDGNSYDWDETITSWVKNAIE
jgi:hypothetical protein